MMCFSYTINFHKTYTIAMKFLSSVTILTGVALASLSVSAQTLEVATTPVGVVKYSIPAGSTLIAPLFVNATEFQGASSGVAENSGAGTTTISFDNAGFVSGEFNEGANFPLYYAESVSNDANEGFGYDIISNTANAITVAGLISDQGLASGQSFVIRKHVTLGQFFEDASGLAVLDNVKFYLGNGSSEVFLYDGSSWFGSVSGDSRPIYPGTGFLTVLSQPVNVTTSGVVKDTDTQVPVFNNPNAINLISSASPVDETVGELQLAVNVGILGSIKFFQPSTLSSAGVLLSDGSNFIGGDGDNTIMYPGEAILVDSESGSNFITIKAPYNN